MKEFVLNNIDSKYSLELYKKIKKKFKVINILNSRSKVLKAVVKCKYLISGGRIKIDREIIDAAKNLKLVISPSTGTDHLDLDYLKVKKIKVVHIAKNYKLLNKFSATSELSFALLLSLLRDLNVASEQVGQGNWPRDKFIGYQLKQKTLGILGLGRLGKMSARIGIGFDMKIIAHDIDKKKMHKVKMVGLNKLFKTSDVIFIHIHLNKKTENLVNYNLMKKMKKNSYLINTSRGKIINEKDLIKALNKKIFLGAGIDVLDGEWLGKKNLQKHILVKYSKKNKNLLITPHIGGSTIESIKIARDYAYDYLLKYSKKKQ